MDLSGLHVFYGGTFDPPHKAHDQMLEALVLDTLVDKIHVVPAFQNPLKSYSKDNLEARLGSEIDRLSWVNLWISDFLKRNPNAKNKIIVEQLEIEKPTPSYTFETLNQLKNKYPNSQWILSVGDDQLSGFEKWHRVEELFSNLAGVWIFSRLYKTEMTQITQNIPQSLRALTSFRIMTQPVLEVSSTQIRKSLREGSLSDLESVLLPPVIQKLRG